LLGVFAFVVFAVATGLLTCDVAGPFAAPPFFAKTCDDATNTAMINAAIAVAAFNI
jgi:hypothetical protein